MRSNTGEKWLEQRIRKYGPVSKLSLFGNPSVFIHGQAANKLVFSGDGSALASSQTKSVRMVLGAQNLLELRGDDHKRVRGAMVSFLKAESLKQYVGKMDQEVRLHIQTHWKGKHEVQVLPLMKVLTFDIICTILFGVERGSSRRAKLVQYFQDMIQGIWAVPINLPFTRYNRSISSSSKVDDIVNDLIAEKRAQLQHGAGGPRDLITSLVDMNNSQAISDGEIIDNIKLIAKSKSEGETLTWEDLGKMKYTWRVAQETMRMFPPIFGGFRNALKDIEFEGYLIPKGWQVFWATGLTHMDQTIFPEPERFDPTRFENTTSVPPYCYIPFGGGARICPGYEFAKVEILVAIHYIVTQFTWKMCADNRFSRDPMPVPTKGLPIKIEPRNRNIGL
ncbi:unnamed protein product [Linum tenue]|uniref:Cytochrome P450 n=1 Tax=Linum tenue TaxID=586396 RepID=A0AAV0H4E4_9ROSI|nr:unnamed protein product [Linum tenue]